MYFFVITVENDESISTLRGLISGEEFPTAQMRYEEIYRQSCVKYGYSSGRAVTKHYYIEKN